MEVKKPIVKRICAKEDFNISTQFDRDIYLFKGQVEDLMFGSEEEYEGHRASGFFDEYIGPKPQNQMPEIPIIYPEDLKPKVEAMVVAPTIEEASDVETTPFVEMLENRQGQVHYIDKQEEEQDLLETANSSGPPYKCISHGCDRLRKIDKLYCRKCEENKG